MTDRLTVIAGRNGAGKSSIVRALASVLLNSCSGVKFIRRGASRYRVTLVCDGRKIERVRGLKKNLFKLDGKILAVPKTTVPESVAEITRVIPENFQRQSDPMFLLSESPGALAKRLNALAGVSVIDEASKRARSDLRALQERHREVASQIEVAEDAIRSLEWVTRASITADSIRALQKAIKETNTSSIEAAIGRVKELRRKPKAPDNLSELIRSIEVELQKIRRDQSMLFEIEESCRRVKQSRAAVLQAKAEEKTLRDTCKRLRTCPLCQRDFE